MAIDNRIDPAGARPSWTIDWRPWIRKTTRGLLEEFCKWSDHRHPAVLDLIKRAARDALGPKPFHEMKRVGARDASGKPIASLMRLTPAGALRATLDRCGVRRDDPYLEEAVMQEIIKEANEFLAFRDSISGRACPPEQLIDEGGRQYRACTRCGRRIDLELFPPDLRGAVREGRVCVRCDSCAKEWSRR